MFHTVEHEAMRKTQNSGVTLTALTSSFASAKDKSPIQDTVAYYGRLFEIVELDYFGRFKVVLFQCEWYDAGKDNEQHEHITSPAIPADDGELILERNDLRPTVIETVPQVTSAQEYEADFIGDSDSDGNKEFIDLKATSSKNLLQQFEAKRQKIVNERKQYVMQGAARNDKEETMPRLDVVESQKDLSATKGVKKYVEIDGLSSELSDDVGDSFSLDENYYSHVMEDINDDQGEPKKKKNRGKTTCKEIYARTMEQREEVFFDIGQPVGPTDQSVSNLTSFVGTIGRNKRFVSLLYTSWHAVTPKAKKFMWNYVNEGAYNTVDIMQTKFILLDSGEKWVIQEIRDAWKRFKGKIKQKHFVPFDTIEDMSISEKNKKHKEQQKFPHRMGPINFGRVRVALNEFQNRQVAGETDKEAFESLFGKEQPGRVRCYGRSVTRSDLKKHVEISELKQQHQEEVTSLKAELGDMKAKQQHQKADLHGLQNMIKLLVQRSEPGMRLEEIEALLQDAQHSPIDVNSAHGSIHIPDINMV
ncbi:uncharacterized protein LOC107470454 [Arachis duranensis]|uniref:Uncharacterized protein LOC107470454 n=1 Tax=Arachis duranensis TaxID=130453 RepID=A0A9C6TCZ3_ARADU|nr:uncharacterized protein LOC107470454 [Arachis duranensis]